MYLIYVDDSGKPELSNRDSYFCLSGIIINEYDWKDIDTSINCFKNQFGITEIHTRNIYRMDREFSYLNQYQGLNLRILGEFYSLISRLNINLVSVVIDKQKYQTKHPIDEVERDCWKFLIERLDMGVADLRRQSGFTWENGLVITDHFSSTNHDELIRSYFQSIRVNGTTYHDVKCIIEEPLFTISKWRNLIQIADAASYCVVMYLMQDSFFMTQFNIIYNKFRCDSTGNINGRGLKIYPS
ncbi:DUF3800 domain-containing protein [Candidatus Nitrosocosmicus arcticus]|uniref:DUF3800 domain-containing protein n=1 Tax=Candidatus Nitrosocosmicus arcticus TaxID=2035267 RepID=A0A557SVA0_9ARCH|nr:DUF3800 domain-containing protein [Candidatus Nitrosocosmicus arcticus]TVP40537.1 hypothetical protein NARC_70118 [Candidatus Nitrosocosmicus arcticus]